MPATLIHDTLWTSGMARALRASDGPLTPRMLMVYLLTCPEKNPYGLFTLEPAILDSRLTGSERDFTKAISVLEALDFCRFDPATGWVWVIEMAHYQFQAPLKDKDYRCLSIKKWYRTAPRNVFMGQWFDRYVRDFHLDREPHAVERREWAPFGRQQAPPPKPHPPGPPSALSTDQDLGFDLSSQDLDQQSLLPRDPRARILTATELDAAFELLWSSYPKGKQKKDARVEFAKLKPTQGLVDDIRESIRLHSTSHEWTKEAGQFVPRMVNWLKRRGWEDRVDPRAPVVSERTSKTLDAARGFTERLRLERDEDPL